MTFIVAIVKGARDAKEVAAYLPDNYRVLERTTDGILIGGTDKMGWTFKDYVAPRLASGNMAAEILAQ